MNEFVYKDYSPANARILIDYNKNDKVKFSYPIDRTYHEAVWDRGFTNVIGFCFYLHLAIARIIILPFYIFVVAYYIFYKNAFFLPTYAWIYVSYIMLFLLYLIIEAFTITLILYLNKNLASKVFPKIGYWCSRLGGNTKERIFTKKDVKNKKVIISSFKNTFLHYKATEDFGKYLKKIKVLEIPYSIKKRSNFLIPWLFRKEYNEYEFNAVFYFSKKPISGSLEVEYD